MGCLLLFGVELDHKHFFSVLKAIHLVSSDNKGQRLASFEVFFQCPRGTPIAVVRGSLEMLLIKRSYRPPRCCMPMLRTLKRFRSVCISVYVKYHRFVIARSFVSEGHVLRQPRGISRRFTRFLPTRHVIAVLLLLQPKLVPIYPPTTGEMNRWVNSGPSAHTGDQRRGQ